MIRSMRDVEAAKTGKEEEGGMGGVVKVNTGCDPRVRVPAEIEKCRPAPNGSRPAGFVAVF
jgi:hypothetical protein